MRVKNTVALGLEYLALAFAALAAVGLSLIVSVIVTSVVMRKIANSPLHITEEAVGLLLSVTLFLGLPMVTLRSKHVRVSLLTSYVGDKSKEVLQIAGLVVGIVFFGWLIWETIPWFEFALKRNLKTETTRILLYPWMALMPLSLAVTAAILVARLVGILESDENTESKQPTSGEAH
ncbi:MAG: TRAP transporter small permease [Hyphomicrobiales bacterium]